MFINAQFKRKDGEYGGRQYSYICNIPDVKPGDLVRVPTPDGESVVRVSEVNVPESKIDERILPILRTALGRAESEKSEAVPRQRKRPLRESSTTAVYQLSPRMSSDTRTENSIERSKAA